MKIVYQATTYRPDLVTGVYVRCNGRKGAYVFRVYEAARELKAGHIATRISGAYKISIWHENGCYHISANEGEKPIYWTTETTFAEALKLFNESPTR